MIYYKLKDNDIQIYNSTEVVTALSKSGDYYKLGDFRWHKCKTKEALVNNIKSLFRSSVDFNKIIKEILEIAPIEIFEVEYPDKPCVIVSLCCGDREPKFYLTSSKELENIDLDFPYEVYLINEDGSLILDERL